MTVISLLPRTPAPWRPASLGLPEEVQNLLQQLGGTFHTYHPFRRDRGAPNRNNWPVNSNTGAQGSQNLPGNSQNRQNLPGNSQNRQNWPVNSTLGAQGNQNLPGNSQNRQNWPVNSNPGAQNRQNMPVNSNIGAQNRQNPPVNSQNSPVNSQNRGFSSPEDYGGPETSFGGPEISFGAPQSLLVQARTVLISRFGLRKLRMLLLWAGAPKALARLCSTVWAEECESLGAAPLTDVFSQPFFHRAVTWRVTCMLDRQPYLTTYAATNIVHGYCVPWGLWHWLGWSAADGWFWVYNEYIMSIWGVVYDDCTHNAFYLLDTPIATLDQIQTRLTACNSSVPEELVWTVVYQVSSALLHMVETGLPYTPLELDNVFLLKDRIALENMLSRKHRLTGCGCQQWRGVAGHRMATNNGSPERCFIHSIAQIIFALITCHLRGNEGDNGATVGHNAATFSPVATLRSLKTHYSPLLLRLLSRTLGGGVTVSLGEIGGGGEGRVGMRAFQWETKWGNLDPVPHQEEWHGLTKSPTQEEWHGLTKSTSPSPSHNTTTNRVVHNSNNSCSSRCCNGMVNHSSSSSSSSSNSSSMIQLQDNSPVELDMIVKMAAENAELLWCINGGNGGLHEAVSTSSHRLIQHVINAQKKHLKTK